MLDSFRYRLRAFTSKYPFLFCPLYSLVSEDRKHMVRKNTELVIEGFPRSANTFTVVAFQYAQNQSILLAHHVHSQAQVLRGVALRVPVCVLIRDPIDAVRSLIIRHPHISLKMGLKTYIDFYKDIYPLRDDYIIATFENVTNDFGKVVEKINEKFGTKFVPFKHTDKAVKEIFEKIELISKSRGPSTEEYMERPSRKKEKLKNNIKLEDHDYLIKKAREIYHQYLMAV